MRKTSRPMHGLGAYISGFLVEPLTFRRTPGRRTRMCPCVEGEVISVLAFLN
jgi:hypothetical protein